MKSVTVIGSGNAFHTDGRSHPSLLLEETGGGKLLLDAGATTLSAMRRLGLSPEDLDGALLTHFHGDHFFGLPFLLLSLNFEEARTRPFAVAGPAGVERVCRAAMELAYPEIEYRYELQFQELGAGSARFGKFHVESYPVTHRPESLGYKITGSAGKTIVFSGDAALDDRLVQLIDGADLAIVEVGLLDQMDPPVSHVSIPELIEARGRLRARRIVFTHLTDAIADRIRSESLGIPASDGLVVSV